jgi:hypothetical protein
MAQFNPLQFWVSPPGKRLPLASSPVRFAVGAPQGPASHSWRIWIHKKDAYIACRDTFREFKVSLHASGIWRLGLTEYAVRNRPDLLPEGKDRVWKKWTPRVGVDKKATIALQVVFLPQCLRLRPEDRRKWPVSVVFIEPSGNDGELVVVSIGVVASTEPAVVDKRTRGAVFAVVPFGPNRTLQVLASHEDSGSLKPVIMDGFRRMVDQSGGPDALPPKGLAFLHGVKTTDIPWVVGVPFRIQRKNDIQERASVAPDSR